MSDPHIILVGGDGGHSGVPRHITHLVAALQGSARITVLSETCRGGYAEARDLGARHVALPGLASSLSPARWRQGRRALAAYLTDHPADLVWGHARMPVIYLRQAILSGHWTKPPDTTLALTYHGLPFGPGHRAGTSTPARRLERKLLSAVPPLEAVFLTTPQKDRMQAAMGPAMQNHRSHVLGNASHLGTLGPVRQTLDRPAGRHLVMTGRAGWQKNYPAALRLMRHLPADITLSLCGAGTDSQEFLRMIKRLAGSSAARVRPLGPLPDVRPLLSTADGYLLLSRYEGLPIGALEASEYGLPLILAPFAEAGALTQDHPMALCLSGPEAAQARDIDEFLARFLENRPVAEADIRAHWETRYTPDRFVAAARNLVFDRFGL